MASFSEVTRAAGRKRMTERVPYSGSGVEALGAQVSAILKVEKDAQRIILDVTKSYIHVEKLVKGQPDQDEEQERFDSILRANPMQEFAPDRKLTPYEYIYNLFKQVTDEGLEVALIFVGNMATLDKWIPVSRKEPRICGVHVRRLRHVPDDLIVVCGAEWAEAELEDIRFTVKGVMS